MIKHRTDSIVTTRIEDIKKEIASRDYQVIKAARVGVDVDAMYPGHRTWYQEKIEALAELETTNDIQDKSPDHPAESGKGG
jgi:hypothetical protein